MHICSSIISLCFLKTGYPLNGLKTTLKAPWNKIFHSSNQEKQNLSKSQFHSCYTLEFRHTFNDKLYSLLNKAVIYGKLK